MASGYVTRPAGEVEGRDSRAQMHRDGVSFPDQPGQLGKHTPRDTFLSALRAEEFGLVSSAPGAAFRLLHKVPWPGKGLAEHCVLTFSAYAQ